MNSNIICLGLEELKECFSDKYDVDHVSTIAEARELLTTKAYDVAVVRFDLGSDKGTSFTKFYPHYRTILVVDTHEQYDEYLGFKNGVYKVIRGVDEDRIISVVTDLIKSSNKKGQEDPMVVLLNINRVLEELTMEVNFLQNNIRDIHSSLSSLKQSQKELADTFEEYKDSKMRSDQFFLTNIAQVEKKVDDVQQKFRTSSSRPNKGK